ncbi:hypothetical protein MRB53_037852 [Persea americana]|nr:hypothetical protein MRB53_037852 [Persea americana]
MNGRIGQYDKSKSLSEPVAMPVGGMQDTSHVPCKFYLQNQCQAGRMCPFSHDLESSTRPTPCKYFAKGHCKFGAKCALLHITPDGVVVNRRQFQPSYSNENRAFGAYPTPPGLLSLQAQGYPQAINGHSDYVKEIQNGYDMTFDNATASPHFGSPNSHDPIATSPLQKLSVLDAPLPNSFDSNGVSMAARNGPFAASVPSRFGLESPPSSLPRKAVLGNFALQELHSSAFGDGNLDSMIAESSPPKSDEPLTFPKRSLYSERLRASRPVMSASVGARPPPQAFDFDDEVDTDQEESLLPASLRDLIPEGRSRRGSRAANEESPASFLAAQRRTLSTNTTPQESKVGSPALGSSPSRYSGIFAQRSVSSDFIGSPLRNSGFAGSSPPSRYMNGELSPSVSSPPRQASMSVLTQELQRTKLDSTLFSTQAVPSAPVRTLSNGSNGRKSLDRTLSSASFGRERIEEEQELFDMDEIGAPARSTQNHGAIGSQRHK